MILGKFQNDLFILPLLTTSQCQLSTSPNTPHAIYGHGALLR